MKSLDLTQTSGGPVATRRRLLRAMAEVLAVKGYAACTVADVVCVAEVSKRTFYEQFSNKEACFLALYRAASLSALHALKAALDSKQPKPDQVEQAFAAYFSHLAAGADLLRALFVDIHRLGSAGVVVRREVMQHLATFMMDTVNASNVRAGASDPDDPILTRQMALAAVGGINELVLEVVESGEPGRLPALAPVATEMVRRLIKGRTG